MKTFSIGFDQAHKERGKISTNFKLLTNFLKENGFSCTEYSEFPITYNNIASFDILVIACPDNSKFSRQEIEVIVNWVKNEGGGLLMLSHAGGDKGRRSNLSELSEQFGIIFENDQVLDKVNNMGVENLPVITNFGFPHPITEGVSRICYRAGCSLTISSAMVTPVVSSSSDADPAECPLMLATEIGDGRIVAIGSYEMLRDKIGGGFKEKSHGQLIFNIFNWLKTTKREQLKAQRSIAVAENETTQPIVNNPQPPQYTTIPLKTFQSNVKIITNPDLFKAFEDMLTELFSFKERMLAEFENLQNNMSNLIRTIIASEDDLVKISQHTEPATISESTNSRKLTPPPSTIQKVNNATSFNSNEEQTLSTPSDYLSVAELAKKIEPEVKVPKEQMKVLKKTKDELEAELDSLENKLNSIKNLTAFVEKKFSSDKLTKKNYDKQIKKLTADLKKTKYRIDEIKKELNKF